MIVPFLSGIYHLNKVLLVISCTFWSNRSIQPSFSRIFELTQILSATALNMAILSETASTFLSWFSISLFDVVYVLKHNLEASYRLLIAHRASNCRKSCGRNQLSSSRKPCTNRTFGVDSAIGRTPFRHSLFAFCQLCIPILVAPQDPQANPIVGIAPLPSSSSHTSSLSQINANMRSLSHLGPLTGVVNKEHKELASLHMSSVVHPEQLPRPKQSETSQQLLTHSELGAASPPNSHLIRSSITSAVPQSSPGLVTEGQIRDGTFLGWFFRLVASTLQLASYKLFILSVQGVAIFSSVAMQLAPSPTILRVAKCRSTGNLEPLPYVMLLLSATLWTLYGLMEKDLIIALPNLIGMILGAVYLYTYTRNCSNPLHRSVLSFYMKLSVAVLVSLFAAIFIGGIARGTLAVGLSAAFFNVINYGAPLSSLGRILRDKSTACMPYEMSVGNFLCTTVWMIYGLVISDMFIFIPSLLGTFVGSMQLALLVAYPSTKGFERIKSRDDFYGKDTCKIDSNKCGSQARTEEYAKGPGGYLTVEDVYSCGNEGGDTLTGIEADVEEIDTSNDATVARTRANTVMRYLAGLVGGTGKSSSRSVGSISPEFHDCREDERHCYGLDFCDGATWNCTDNLFGNEISNESKGIGEPALTLSPGVKPIPNSHLWKASCQTPSSFTDTTLAASATSIPSSPSTPCTDSRTSLTGALAGYIFPPTPSSRSSHRLTGKVGGHIGIVVPSVCDRTGLGLPTHATLLKHVFGQGPDESSEGIRKGSFDTRNNLGGEDGGA